MSHTAADSPRLILASQSPRRSLLLGELGYRFVVLPAHADEWEEADANPRELVLHNAELKAESIAQENPGDWVLAADTTVALHNEVLNKPADLDEARAMLRKLSGQTHTVYTGICLMRTGGGAEDFKRADSITSRVVFQTLSEERITEYFGVVNPLDKAGAYGIQEGRELIIDHYEGSLTNIMGLPTEAVQEWLTRLGLDKQFTEQARCASPDLA